MGEIRKPTQFVALPRSSWRYTGIKTVQDGTGKMACSPNVAVHSQQGLAPSVSVDVAVHAVGCLLR